MYNNACTNVLGNQCELNATEDPCQVFNIGCDALILIILQYSFVSCFLDLQHIVSYVMVIYPSWVNKAVLRQFSQILSLLKKERRLIN